MPQTPADAAKQIAPEGDPKGFVPTFFKQARVLLISSVRDNFNRGESPDGIPWTPLKFNRPSGPGKPLRDKGLLLASITHTGSNHVEVATDDSLTIGTNRPGANLHQFGGTVVPNKAKALTIPITKEATRSPARNFPRPLTLLWRAGAASGVLAEIRSERQTARAKQLHKAARIAAAKAKKSGQKSFEKVAQNFRDAARAIDKKRKAFVVQYILVKSVTVPARPFLGFGKQLITDLEALFLRRVKQFFVGSKSSGT